MVDKIGASFTFTTSALDTKLNKEFNMKPNNMPTW